jgi:capsular polysaccharide biosynthesis protein
VLDREPAQRQRTPVDQLGEHLIGAVPHPVADVVLVRPLRPARTANEYAALAPGARIHLLTARPLTERQREILAERVLVVECRSLPDRVEYLSRIPPPQVIVDYAPGRLEIRLKAFRRLFWFVADGGRFAIQDHSQGAPIVDGVSAFLTRLRADIDARSPSLIENDRTLGAAVGGFEPVGPGLVVTKRSTHFVKIRDRAANEMLPARFGARWGELVAVRAPHSWVSPARVTGYGTGPTPAVERPIAVPERSLRRYRDVTCWPNARLAIGNYLLPDTFRHPSMRRLHHRGLLKCTSVHAALRDAPTSGRTLDGSYFFFDSEYPGHFGHVTTEVVSRYWGWLEARQIDPEIRPLITADDSHVLPGFQQKIFRALDIDPGRVEFIDPAEFVQVSVLYGATPEFSMPAFVDGGLGETWARISAANRVPGRSGPAKIFVSRKSGKRACHNRAEVEDLFRDLGFVIVFPEEHSFEEQVTMFADADVLAGFAGSGMFGMMWGQPKTTILIGASSYTATNEYLIGSVLGSDLHYFWGPSDIAHPVRGWTWPAFQSNFTFDVDRFEHDIRRVANDAGQAPR